MTGLSSRAVRPLVVAAGLGALCLSGLPPAQALPAPAGAASLETASVDTASVETLATTNRLAGTSCTVFPANNYWNTRIDKLPVNKRSAQWMSHLQPSRRLHPDFGPAYGEQPVPYGIPITIVGSKHAKVSVKFQYASESDRRSYPLGSDTKIEGGAGAGGDRHAVIVDKSTCRVYETFATRKTSSGWRAGSGATWSLNGNALRPKGWTSADAAGLPILPGLLRLSEVKAGHVNHAIRFTADVTNNAYVWPARHRAGAVTSAAYPPMGARFRLKASFSTAGYRKDTKAVLRAMKNYGLVLADNGSSWYFQGQSVKGWPSGLLDELKSIPARAFEAVDVSSLKMSSGSARTK